MSDKREKALERLHIVSTVAAYPGLSTQQVRDRANNECQHDSFDPLPRISPQGITAKLNALSLKGVVRGEQVVEGIQWYSTPKGDRAVALYEATLDAEASA